MVEKDEQTRESWRKWFLQKVAMGGEGEDVTGYIVTDRNVLKNDALGAEAREMKDKNYGNSIPVPSEGRWGESRGVGYR